MKRGGALYVIAQISHKWESKAAAAVPSTMAVEMPNALRSRCSKYPRNATEAFLLERPRAFLWEPHSHEVCTYIEHVMRNTLGMHFDKDRSSP